MICLNCKNYFDSSNPKKKWCSEKCRKHFAYNQNKNKEKARTKLYRENHSGDVKNAKQKYYNLNKTKILQYSAEYCRKRLKTDLEFKLRYTLRNRIRRALKNQFSTKASKTINLLGCSIEECRKYLESKFQDGMTWDNYGKWEIDHIIPCIAFDLTNIEEQKKCFNYTNLQPLWWRDNRTKGNKV